MKNLLLTTIAIITLSSFAKANQDAFQAGADQMTVIIKCQPLKPLQDVGMLLTVTTGGIAGLTQVRIERISEEHTSTENYIVKTQPVDPKRLGAPTTFIGKGIRLTANFNTLLPNGKHYGTLQLGTLQNSTIEQLACELMQQNPQVNYPF